MERDEGKIEYTVEFTPKALKDYAKLQKVVAKRVIDRINSLSYEPAQGKVLKGELKGKRSLRVGDYRIIYQLEGRKVIILAVGHRREVY